MVSEIAHLSQMESLMGLWWWPLSSEVESSSLFQIQYKDIHSCAPYPDDGAELCWRWLLNSWNLVPCQ